MFNDVGKKIMLIADIYAVIGMVGSIFAGIYFIYQQEISIAVATILIGPLYFYLSAIFIFGFGKLIENTENAVVTMSLGFDEVVSRTNRVAIAIASLKKEEPAKTAKAEKPETPNEKS